MKNKKYNNSQLEGIKKYIDMMSENYSKLNIVRLDLSYKKLYINEITLEDANKELKRMINNMRSKPSIFRDKIGYIIKKEYTKDKGIHFHIIFIYDGQKTKNSAFKAEQIGQYWEQLTNGKGSFHNCHRNNYKHNSIGILNYKDTEKRKILDEYVISYLCKNEQNIESIKENKKDRAFTRGTIPKDKTNRGRPRNQKIILNIDKL
ncbi:inovirus Gp2 family protein [Arcobacter sp. KX21116]|uniref:YagK/YfjJ domain-containing protein n=1 Tax=Arcobacter iocasae TaxID=2906515 RepID=UPI0035D4AEDD